MKPGTFIHSFLAGNNFLDHFFFHSLRPRENLPTRKIEQEIGSRVGGFVFLLQTTTTFVPAREDPSRHAERYPWKSKLSRPFSDR